MGTTGWPGNWGMSSSNPEDGSAAADAVAVTSPEAVFLFGGLAQAGDFLLEPVRRYLDEKLLYVYRGNVKVLPSGIPAQNAAILGASALVWAE